VTDEKGVISLATQPLESIELLFAFCPEKVSLFKSVPAEHNSFVFRFEPWMMEFFFENFKLAVTDKGLRGASPVLEGDFVYRKN
jgi:hypothetical protein